MEINTIPDAIFIETMAGNLLDVNSAACELFGYSREELMSIRLPDLIPESASFTLTLLMNGEITKEATGRHKNGDIFPIYVRSQRLRLDDDQEVAFVFIRDISQKKRLEKALTQTSTSIQTLTLCIQAIATGDTIQDILDTIVQASVEALSANQVFLTTFDLKRGEVTGFHKAGAGVQRISQPTFSLMMQELEVYGYHLDVEDHLICPISDGSNPNLPDITEFVIVTPVQAKGQLLGVITTINRSDQRAFTPEDASLMETIAVLAATAVHQEILLNQERENRKHSETLREVARFLNANMEQRHLLEMILDQLALVLEYDSGSVMLFKNGKLSILAQRKFRAVEQMAFPYPDRPLAHIQQVIETREPVIIADAHKDPRWQRTPHSDYIRCWLGVPLIGNDEVIGLLNLDKEQPGYYTEESAMMAIAFANQAATAIENARLYQAAQDGLERAMILHQVSQEIVAASLDPEGIYSAIHNAAAQLMPAEAFAITLVDDARQNIHAVYLIDRSGRVPTQTFPIHRGITSQVIESGNSLYIEDTQAEVSHTDILHYGDKEHVRSLLSVPMRLRGQVIGTISSQSYEPNSYTLEDQYFLEMLAVYAAIALDNANLFGEIQQLAITDGLTGLYNRRHLFELGKREYGRAIRFERPLSVIMIDIDHFKEVNDEYGHTVGDFILHQLAVYLTKQIREIDVIGRYGGEEFIVILPETRLPEAVEVAERLRDRVSNHVFEYQGVQIPVTISLGAAELTQDIPAFPSLIEKADVALYDAKNLGRNRVIAAY